MARRRSRSSLARVLLGDGPLAPALSLYAILLGMAVLAGLVLAGVGDGAAGVDALLELAALLLAFLAGVRFARGLAGAPRLALAAAAMTISALAALLLPPPFGLVVLAFLHAAQGMWDVWSADGVRLPVWYAGLRARTAPLAAAILVVAFFSGV